MLDLALAAGFAVFAWWFSTGLVLLLDFGQRSLQLVGLARVRLQHERALLILEGCPLPSQGQLVFVARFVQPLLPASARR